MEAENKGTRHNYRVIKIRGMFAGMPWENVVIRTCFYNNPEVDPNSVLSIPSSISESNLVIAGEDVADMASEIAKIQRALSMPVIDWDAWCLARGLNPE